MYTYGMFEADVDHLVDLIQASPLPIEGIYGVPQGGVPLAMALAQELSLPLVGFESEGKLIIPRSITEPSRVLIVDDVIDSGKTFSRFNPAHPRACLHKKEGCTADVNFCAHFNTKGWVTYWWEGTDENRSVEDIVLRQLQFLGEDVSREGLQDTPSRVVKSWKTLFNGYHQDPESVMTTFTDGACDEMVILKDIEFYSTCEHHMLPFCGKAHIAYIPDGKVIGVSKLARLLDIFAHRLQIQERIGTQVTDALTKYLAPKGAACIIEAQHLCMKARGVRKQDSVMITSSLTGAFREKPEAKAELMGLIR